MPGKITIRFLPHPEVAKSWIQSAVKRAAVWAAGRIKERTAQGIDADGNPFRPYSASYAALRAAAGRGTAVDLTLTGAMLGNLKLLRSTDKTATIGFEGQHRVTFFGRVKGAWSQLHGPRKAGRLIGARGRFATEWVQTGKGRKLPGGGRATRTLGRASSTTSMAAIVLGNNRRRPFFFLRSPQEIRQLHAVAQDELDRLIREDKAE